MKTLYLSELHELPEPGTYFVIGVKAPDDDEDELLIDAFTQLQLDFDALFEEEEV